MSKNSAASRLLALHVVPNAPQSAVTGRHGNALKIKLHAPAADNKANAELIRFLSEKLGIPQSGIEIVRGHKSREKAVSLGTFDAARAESLLLATVKH